MVVYIKPKLVD